MEMKTAMRMYLLFGLLLFTFAVLAGAQTRSSEGGRSQQFEPDRSKPSVYLSFERIGKSEPLLTKSAYDDQDHVFLRLRNNTRSPIAVDANYDVRLIKLVKFVLPDGSAATALPDGAEVKLCHEAVAMSLYRLDEYRDIKVPDQSNYLYNCARASGRSGPGDNWIRPGESVVFGVPKVFLGPNLRIYTLFNYAWETERGYVKLDEPHHQVFYYSTDLINREE